LLLSSALEPFSNEPVNVTTRTSGMLKNGHQGTVLILETFHLYSGDQCQKIGHLKALAKLNCANIVLFIFNIQADIVCYRAFGDRWPDICNVAVHDNQTHTIVSQYPA